MPFPQTPAKHASRPLFDGRSFRRYQFRRHGGTLPRVPRSIAVLFGHRWSAYLLREFAPKLDSRTQIYRAGPDVGILHLEGPGAPFLSIAMEETAALGARRFVLLGIAGSLQPAVPPGSVVLCSKALRDEGTSHHYAPPARFATPSRSLSRSLARALRAAGEPFVEGPTWTIDAPYRETIAEIRRYRRMGIVTVEMEAAAAFTIARSRRLAAAGIFVVSDHVVETGWEPRFHETKSVLERLLPVVTRALA